MFLVDKETGEQMWLDIDKLIFARQPAADIVLRHDNYSVLEIYLRGMVPVVTFQWNHTEDLEKRGITPLEDFISFLENEKKIGGNNRE